LLRVPDGTHDDLPDAGQILESLLRYPKKAKKVIPEDDHFEWLLKRERAKKKIKPYIYGSKGKPRFPFKTLESYR
jgi:hypothetical protein